MRFLGIKFETIYGAHDDHDTPYMTRVVAGRLRLHIFHRGDADPDPHNHPWAFWTFPLTGYVEEVTQFYARPTTKHERQVLTRYRQVVEPFRWHFRRASHTHRVIGRWNGERYLFGDKAGKPFPHIAPRKKVVTIVWTGPTTNNEWGFWKDGCFRHWADYIFRGGKHAPCEA